MVTFKLRKGNGIWQWDASRQQEVGLMFWTSARHLEISENRPVGALRYRRSKWVMLSHWGRRGKRDSHSQETNYKTSLQIEVIWNGESRVRGETQTWNNRSAHAVTKRKRELNTFYLLHHQTLQAFHHTHRRTQTALWPTWLSVVKFSVSTVM